MKILTVLLFLPAVFGQTFLDTLDEYGKRSAKQELFQLETERIYKEYDFIVVGAGSAGCIVTSRLTENPDWKVLLIEAGGSETYYMDIPGMAGTFTESEEVSWKYKTEPSDNYCLGMTNRQCNWSRGKVMGGSGSLNSMIYTRGNRRDYDNWAELNNTGWSYEEVLPYFKKIEDFQIPEYKNDTKYHSQGGHITVSYTPYRSSVAAAAIQAEIEVGYDYVDYNGEKQIGVSYAQTSTKNGTRNNSNNGYLFPIRDRKNFHLRKNSTVKKILINQSKKAYGVQFVKNGKTYTVYARKEVILSAGAINSPQLLMLSGIGPQDHLKEKKIPVIQDLKVGYNLMDHFGFATIFFTNATDTTKSTDYLNSTLLTEYIFNQSGLYTIVSGVLEVISFHDTTDPLNPDGYPDIEIMYLTTSFISNPGVLETLNIDNATYFENFATMTQYPSVMFEPYLLRPKSRGRLTLRNKDYRSKPVIDAAYYTDPEDVETMIRGQRLLLNITQTSAFKSMGLEIYNKSAPNCLHEEFNSDSYWECAARDITLTIYHYSGTCKMGPETDEDAVVDPRLRVYGIKGLRVIDASIMPEIPAAHTNSPTYMIGEKGADMIKEDWGWIQKPQV